MAAVVDRRGAAGPLPGAAAACLADELRLAVEPVGQKNVGPAVVVPLHQVRRARLVRDPAAVARKVGTVARAVGKSPVAPAADDGNLLFGPVVHEHVSTVLAVAVDQVGCA